MWNSMTRIEQLQNILSNEGCQMKGHLSAQVWPMDQQQLVAR